MNKLVLRLLKDNSGATTNASNWGRADMASKLSVKCASAVVLALLLTVPVSFTAQAAEKEQESVLVKPELALPSVSSPTLYKLDTPTPYKSIKIGDSDIVDVIPQSDHTIYIIPKAFGVTNLMFFDENKVMIKDLNIEIKHPVELIATSGPRGHALKSFYSCWSTGCQFVSEDKLELPSRPIDIKGGQPVGTSITVGSN